MIFFYFYLHKKKSYNITYLLGFGRTISWFASVIHNGLSAPARCSTPMRPGSQLLCLPAICWWCCCCTPALFEMGNVPEFMWWPWCFTWLVCWSECGWCVECVTGFAGVWGNGDCFNVCTVWFPLIGVGVVILVWLIIMMATFCFLSFVWFTQVYWTCWKKKIWKT